MQWKKVLGVLLVAVAVIYGYEKMTNRWETISTNFMKGDKPYGGGDFVIRGDQVISLKIAEPVQTFKPDKHPGDWNAPLETTEPWMNDTNQLLNRTTVNFIRGTIQGATVRRFSEPGQSGAWWYSRDWNTIFVSTGWTDFTLPNPSDGLSPQVTRLWRSQDAGSTWTQLKWPENHNIGQLLFLDPMRGYAIGWGPRVWRTGDAGQTWQEIQVPPLAGQREPRATFDGVDLARNGVLRVAYYVNELHDIRASSAVYRLDWDRQQFEPETVLPNQTVVRMQSAPDGTRGDVVYVLCRPGPRNDDKMGRGGSVWVWNSSQPAAVQQLHTFAPPLTINGMVVGVGGVLIAYATDASQGAPIDYSLYSTNAGRTWTQSDDGLMLGGSFDPDTSTEYGLSAYTLKKRKF